MRYIFLKTERKIFALDCSKKQYQITIKERNNNETSQSGSTDHLDQSPPVHCQEDNENGSTNYDTKDNGESVESNGEADGESSRCCPVGVQKSPTSFTMNALTRAHDDHSRLACEIMNWPGCCKWIMFTLAEVEVSFNMKYYRIDHCTRTKQVLHTKFMLRHKRDDHRNISKHKDSLVISGNDERDYENYTRSPMVHITAVKRIMSFISKQV